MQQPDFTPSVRQLMKRAEGAMKKEQGGFALQLFDQVLASNPNHVEALYNSGFILFHLGRFDNAQQYLERAITIDPSHIDSYIMLSQLLQEQNNGEQGIKIAHLATQMAPDNASAHLAVCNALIRFNQGHTALSYLEGILPKFPKNMELWQVYGMALKLDERHEEADAVYDRLINEFKTPFPWRVLYETFLPRLYRSREDIDRTRERFKASLDMFIKRNVKVDITAIQSLPTFQLAFHNHDNKELTRLYVKALRAMDPRMNYTAPHCKAALAKRDGKIRVGFISRHMYKHSVGNCYRNIMIALAQHPDFDVTFFNLSTFHDEGIQAIIDGKVTIVPAPKSLAATREMIEPYKLDIIVFPDIGMDAMTSYIAMSRLAPYQLCLQGHPETTGIDTIDYVVSSRSYEPPHGDENYSERLLCTSTIDTTFKRPATPGTWMTRQQFGLPEDKKLYVCPMTIQKFHPDFDDVLAGILDADPNGMIVLFQDFQQQSSSKLMQERITKRCPPGRVIFLPWLTQEQLFSIMKLADAVIDTIYFGGGTTIQYAFHFGIPVVTMPGHYARGRVTYSYYSIMDVPEAPLAKDAKEYVELAVKLANDSTYHQKLSEEILARNAAMFETEPYAPKFAQLMHDIIDQNLDAYKR